MAAHSYAELSATLKYEPETGRLFWTKRPRELCATLLSFNVWNTKYAGKEAFLLVNQDGYLKGTVFGKTYVAHRVAWLLHYGVWPTHEIDHIDGNRQNNRIANLREVTTSANSRNMKMLSTNKSGVTGVCWNARAGKWQASIGGPVRKNIYLGVFDDKDAAIAARRQAEKTYGYTERHGLR